ncbi:hypothetical protein V7654_05045 [Bacillus sp. JJ1609]|uniref:hypothetical protein n=1 Tax=Bacillus sp. JJ1609 TaxID=3122977 RepID=UPI003000F00F
MELEIIVLKIFILTPERILTYKAKVLFWKRAKAYVESGAIGIFVPGLIEDDEIKEITMNVSAN